MEDEKQRKITFFFHNGMKLPVMVPKQIGEDPVSAMVNVKKTLESDRILIEVEGELLVIPVASLIYVRIHPAPESLPMGMVFRGAKLLSE